MWNKTKGNRGSNEIKTFLLTFIELLKNRGVEEFIFYSDNCAYKTKIDLFIPCGNMLLQYTKLPSFIDFLRKNTLIMKETICMPPLNVPKKAK